MKIIKYIQLLCMVIMITSCNSDYYTLDDYAKVKKIDMHAHIRTKANFIVEQAIKDNFRLLTINTDSRSTVEFMDMQQELAVYHKENTDGLVQYFAGFSIEKWGEENWQDNTIDYLKQTFKQGALGVKVWKNIGMRLQDSDSNFIMIDDESFDPIFELMEENNMPLIAHCGEPKNCWLPYEEMSLKGTAEYFSKHPDYYMYLHPEYPSYEQQIEARDNMLKKHPNLKVIGAHLGSIEWSVDELAKRLDKYPNFAVDMAARITYLQIQTIEDHEKVRDFFIKYQDRLLYGIDMVTYEGQEPVGTKNYIHGRWISDWEYFTTDNTMSVEAIDGEFQALHLPKEVIDKIYYTNTIKWCNFPEI